jgi:DNA-binding response OmpR family regulator
MKEFKGKILMVEDDPNFGMVLGDFLRMNGYEVVQAADGSIGLHKFKRERFDLVLLDVMMPQMDGYTLASHISSMNYYQTPLIFITAKEMKEDVLKGYKLGADDYIIKPFDSEVLLMKIEAVLNRSKKSSEQASEYRIGKLTYRPTTRELETPSGMQRLSPKEGKLLELLCESKNDLLPRSKALNLIWKDDNYFTARSMDVYIAKLRKILKEEPNAKIINIHGEGFRLMTQGKKESIKAS